MNKIYIVLLLLVALPIVLADTCTDLACLENYSIWDDTTCFDEICLQGLTSTQSPACYTVLCSASDIMLPSGCEDTLCPNDNPPPNTNFDITSESGLRSQFNFFEDDISSLKIRLDSLETEDSKIKASISGLKVDDIKKELSLIKQDMFRIKASVKNLESAQDELLSPSTNWLNIAIYSIIGLIAVGLIIANFVSFSEINKLRQKKVSPEKISRILEYESTYLHQGYPNSAIHQGLLNQGFTDEQINEAHKK